MFAVAPSRWTIQRESTSATSTAERCDGCWCCRDCGWQIGRLAVADRLLACVRCGPYLVNLTCSHPQRSCGLRTSLPMWSPCWLQSKQSPPHSPAFRPSSLHHPHPSPAHPITRHHPLAITCHASHRLVGDGGGRGATVVVSTAVWCSSGIRAAPRETRRGL